MAARATHLEQRARRVEVDPHAEIEIGFGLPADDRREVEDRARLRIDRAFEHRAIGDVADDRRHARVTEIAALDDAEQHQLVDLAGPAVRAGQLAALEQLARETLAEKAAAAGDQYFHVLHPLRKTGITGKA
ncbi:hypothetical protein NLI96_g13414 [Meripilus lineatus]|uniref:Uncharacterized protein n=1 Tax=Meripilus lineatus TaxID=2056292 RepID=A0AAD5US43_9APHY|nr:hypothetical protein NLI96_g13414 [Physisporinus lineatus]